MEVAEAAGKRRNVTEPADKRRQNGGRRRDPPDDGEARIVLVLVGSCRGVGVVGIAQKKRSGRRSLPEAEVAG